ncbi:MAG: hypothetical protein H8E25_07605 [Planctomycetes bacterium]|nr:hypothetical protein [Planctomycetota bacterium]
MILSTLSLVFFAAQARVDLLDGSKSFGEISNINLNAVTIVDSNGDELVINNDLILEVVPTLSPEMMAAESAALKLDFMNATNGFDDAASKADKPYLAAYAKLKQAEAFVLWASSDASQYSTAITQLKTWVSDNSDSFWLPRAQMALSMALAKTGDIDGATKLMSTLSDMAFEKNLARHIELQANVIRCHAFLIGDQAQVAQSRLASLSDKIGALVRDSETPSALLTAVRELQSKVQILVGQAIRDTEGMASSKSYWQALSDDSATSPVVRSAAWLGLAEAAIDGDNLRSAQLQLAKIVATMPSSPDVTPQALFLLADVSNQLEDAKTSRSALNQLSSSYPNSDWAIKAASKGL